MAEVQGAGIEVDWASYPGFQDAGWDTDIVCGFLSALRSVVTTGERKKTQLVKCLPCLRI